MKSDRDKSSDTNDQAAEWVWKNDRGLSAAEQDAFTDWLGESRENREAYAEHSFAWEELARLAGLQNTDYAPVVPDLLGSESKPWYSRYFQRSKWAVLIPIAATMAFVAGYMILDKSRDQTVSPETTQPVVINQIQQQRLEDGSVVDLNKGAHIEIFLTDSSRLVKLISGEANFRVAKDSSRPFIVEASGVRVRAVGTVFNVRLDNRKIDVVVTEGTVAIGHPEFQTALDQGLGGESIVRERHRATVDLQRGDPRITVGPVNLEQISAELIWHPEIIDFENAPLSQIVEEFNRRNPVKIRIRDEEIATLRFTSIFWSNNVESFVRLLEANYGITADITSDSEIVLSNSPQSM